MGAESKRPSLDAHAIRESFLKFFEGHGHTRVPSSPLVPHDDPTLLFVNAGMVQFKDVFTGRESRPYQRATSSQRCLRAGGKHNDLDNVGFTPRHHTLFEMLGNFSFGDYFKAEAIEWGWTYLTEVLRIPAERLVVSVFNGEGEDAPFDQEAYELWKKYIPEERIYAFDSKENFWQMGDVGPCGPCSEIHIFKGDVAPPDAKREGRFGPAFEEDRYTELWNLVFMQYEKRAGGDMVALPKPSVDTGAGLERLAAVMADVQSNYETELLSPLVALGRKLAGAGAAEAGPAPFHVIADHARATAFLIADGVFPDKGGRNYVLRRIMRRAIRYGTRVGLEEPFFHEVCAEVVRQFEGPYPELKEAAATIEEVVRTEEELFRRTLDRGLHHLDKAMSALEEGTSVFPVSVAAELYDTYGFPIDLSGVIAKEHGMSLDEPGVDAEVRRRQGAGQHSFEGGGTGVADVYFQLAEAHGASAFLGYDEVEAEGTVLAVLVGDNHESVARAEGEGTEVQVVLERTPFYAESGGQLGDRGRVQAEGLRAEVTDTIKPAGDVHVHCVRIESGAIEVGDRLSLRVDTARRDAIRRNHSATHLLHHALREVLGKHVAQKGSLVAPDRLRFDFSHARAMSEAERREVERLVNAEVLRNDESQTREMSLPDAKEAGAIGLFGEKYGDHVRVVSIGHESVELCGGTHVRRAGDIGLFTITSEGGIAQGVRRIEAVTGEGALAHVQHLDTVVASAAATLAARDPDEVLERIERLQRELKQRTKEVADLERKLATGGSGDETPAVEVAGVKLLAKKVAVGDPKVMREAADTLRDRLGTGVVVLAGERDGKASLLVAVTKDLTPKVHAGRLVGKLAAEVDGRGGGRPDLAQAGGPNVAGIEAALARAPEVLAEMVGG